MEKKTSNQKLMNLFEGKSMLNVSVLMNIRQDFKIVKIVLIEQRWKNSLMCKKKDHINFQLFSECFFFENLFHDWHRQ